MKGIFIGLSEPEILAIRASAREAAGSGRQVTSFSAPGLSTSFQSTMPPHEVILECDYALEKLDPATYSRRLTTKRTRAIFY